MPPQYALGLDFGTNSARCLVVRLEDGAELGTAVHPYARGEAGILLDRRDPDLARQHPADYLDAIAKAIPEALTEAAGRDPEFRPDRIAGAGVDATASTPMPVDETGTPLALNPAFAGNLNAMAWLWKDHTSTAEATEITALAARIRPAYLAKCGGSYSSEWFFSKVLHCLRTAPEVFAAAHSWLEIADWIPARLTGTEAHSKIRAGICAAGHKGLYHTDWGGYPDEEFLGALDPRLAALRSRLPREVVASDQAAGRLTPEWAAKLGLPEGLPVAVGAIDAHLGAVGSGIKPGRLVKIMGTSTCDMMVQPMDQPLSDIPGVCGIVPGSILPGCYGIEAGQSAVGDLFNWLVNVIRPGGAEAGSHEALTHAAASLHPGESGLLALDWNNGNRNILADQRLTGLLLGQTLQTRPEEIYLALIEATAFGALMIIQRLEEYGVKIEEIVNCGGIAEKSPLVMDVYANVTGRPMKLSRSPQTCALGAAMCGAVAGGAYPTLEAAAERMTGVKDVVYTPDPAAHAVYRELFGLYREVHDAFGRPDGTGGLGHVMKRLIEIRTQARKG